MIVITSEISDFIAKVRNKLALLGGVLADELEDERSLQLAVDLSNFLEVLLSPYNNWTDIEVTRYIHLWNKRADLNNLPVLEFDGLQVNIIQGLPDNSDFLDSLDATIREVVATIPHNQLAQIQGGGATQRYHLTKAQLDWIDCQMSLTPCPAVEDPLVTLQFVANGTLWSSGYHELGTSVTVTTLNGNIVLNNGGVVQYYRYLRGFTELIRVDFSSSPNDYVDNTTLTSNTTYTFEASFTNGGLKVDSKSILFAQPMYSGIMKRVNASGLNALALTKNVRAKGNLELTFTLPVDNTIAVTGQEYTPVVFIPSSWGLPLSIKVGDFDFIDDWSVTSESMILADGSTLPGLLFVFNNTTEGITTFNFNF